MTRRGTTRVQRHVEEEGGCFPSLLFTLLLVSGSGVFWTFFAEPWGMLIESLRWEKTPCIILSSRPERTQGPTYRPEVRYRYFYGGATYTSNRLWLTKPSPATHAQVKAIVERYPEGRSFCYVSPTDPRAAVLDRSFQPQLLIALVPLTLAFTGLFGLLSQLSAAYHQSSPVRESANLPTARPICWNHIGAITCRGRSGFRALASAVMFALLWNGVVWFLIRAVIQTWRSGVPGCHGWLLSFFAVPFVLVGLGSIAVAGYMFLGLLNPRPTLRVSAGAVAAGQSVDINWHFSRCAGRIRRLRVYLEGREEATYVRGDRIVTDREVFATVVLVNATQSQEIRSGGVRFTVPADAVPSFESRHNRIAWAVCIAGEIQRWPDVFEEIEIGVIPNSMASLAAAPGSASGAITMVTAERSGTSS